jgi:hydroxyacylglutathione hydrolase
MKVEIISCLRDNYSYLIIDETNNLACVVDPSEARPIIDYLKNKNINLKYILNTHHHFDHVGGNEELKKKYNAIVVGYKHDSERIPEIDILLEDNEIWERDNFVAKIIHVPGHTKGHICFNFYKEKLLFTGDTLFSLGCGKIFEGTYEQMFNSLEKIKALPLDTKIFCGHEYTLNNSKFCIKYDNENLSLQKKIQDIEIKLNDSLPTIPSTLKEELDCNIFLRAKDLKTFSKLRDLKDNFLLIRLD